MIARQFDPVAELQSAFTALTKNINLIVIPLVTTILCFAVFAIAIGIAGGSAFLASGFNDPSAWMALIGTAAVGVGIGIVIATIISLIGQAAVIAGAESVWQGRAPDLGAGVSRAVSRVVDLFLAGLLGAIMCLIVAITFVGPVVVFFFMLYLVPAIVIGGESGVAAIGTSFRIVTQNFGYSFAAFIGIVLVFAAGFIVQMILGHIPILGWIVGLLVSAFTSAYAAMAAVRFYDLLRGTGTPLAAPVSGGPPPPPPPMPTPTPGPPPAP